MTEPGILFKEMSDQEFNQWRNSPITAGFFAFLKDQEGNFRQAAMDLWEMGNLGQRSDVLRGQVQTLGELAELRVETIKAFYSAEESNEAATA